MTLLRAWYACHFLTAVTPRKLCCILSWLLLLCLVAVCRSSLYATLAKLLVLFGPRPIGESPYQKLCNMSQLIYFFVPLRYLLQKSPLVKPADSESLEKIAGNSQCSKAWLGYLTNAKKLLGNREIILENLASESIAVITWFHYYDLMGQFTRRRWQFGRNPATKTSDITDHIDPVSRIESFEVSVLYYSAEFIAIAILNTYLYHVFQESFLVTVSTLDASLRDRDIRIRAATLSYVSSQQRIPRSRIISEG